MTRIIEMKNMGEAPADNPGAYVVEDADCVWDWTDRTSARFASVIASANLASFMSR